MRSHAPAGVVWAGILLLAYMGGCASRSASPLWSVESTAPPATASLAAALDDIAPRAIYLAADDEVDSLIVRKEAGDTDDETLLVRSQSAGGGSERVVREQLLRRTADGVELSKEINHREGVTVLFEPPLLVLPREVDPDRPSKQTLYMRVHPIGNENRIRAEGEVRNTVSIEALGSVRTPAGTFESMKILSVFEADLGVTKVRNRTEQWFAPGLGVVVERRREQTTLLGVAIRDSTETWVLKAAEGSNAR